MRIDRDWVPTPIEGVSPSLYIRPTFIGTEVRAHACIHYTCVCATCTVHVHVHAYYLLIDVQNRHIHVH